MPKKFAGENTKAASAKARKLAAKEENQRKLEQEKEDEYWKDNDKQVQKKLQRKEQQEKKRLEQIQKKNELKSLIEKEELSLKPKQAPAKLTRAQIPKQIELRNTPPPTDKKKEKELDTHINKPLEENINRIEADGLEARSVIEAISILSTKDVEEDKNPSKRMKAAYASYEAANLPRIKAENPTLRLSQLKQILNKDWMRAAENPMNQRRN